MPLEEDYIEQSIKELAELERELAEIDSRFNAVKDQIPREASISNAVKEAAEEQMQDEIRRAEQAGMERQMAYREKHKMDAPAAKRGGGRSRRGLAI